ncbi:hypothetical protein MYA_4531 [Burkholderia sp. KJ006]|nr:hypothetical protein MYA_4531 [Burkholderia sp. KJ006]
MVSAAPVPAAAPVSAETEADRDGRPVPAGVVRRIVRGVIDRIWHVGRRDINGGRRVGVIRRRLGWSWSRNLGLGPSGGRRRRRCSRGRPARRRDGKLALRQQCGRRCVIRCITVRPRVIATTQRKHDQRHRRSLRSGKGNHRMLRTKSARRRAARACV